MKVLKRLFWAALILLLIGGAAMALPPVRDRVMWRVNELSIRLRYALRPPEKQVFVPEATVDENAFATQTALTAAATATPQPSPTTTTGPDAGPSATPTIPPTPLPAQANIAGVKYINQQGLWNYCAPANLAMALTFWGWQGDRTDIGKWVKPFEKDKNVMPYELADYVKAQTQFAVVVRSGGTLAVVKSLVAAGFPVMVEKGAFMQDISGKTSWMGHYTVVTGYDDAVSKFTTQDSFYEANYPVSYDEFTRGWRSFNYLFMVVYPPEREDEVLTLLGKYSDENAGLQAAAQTASEEIYTTRDSELFFAWYNRGTSLVGLQDYLGAAAAYDEAFRIYAGLEEKQRPWRMVWYQTGPYFAYFYSGRYADVDKLATQTIDAASEPYIEESFYWRARAREALGDSAGAVDDLRKSLEYHPGFEPSLAEFKNMGVAP
jgi:tetratricopeptide (TPR) repeat protein